MERYEDKFLIPSHMLSEIQNIFEYDSINYPKSYPSRIVNSIYYDTDDLFYARQNSDGNGERVKIRIRFYDRDAKKSNIEIKYKRFSLGKKVLIPIIINENVPDTTRLIEKLKPYSEINFDEILTLRPKLFVSYKRKYWVSQTCKNLRITLDSNISAKAINTIEPIESLFDYACSIQDFGVLEIKYNCQENIEFFRKDLQKYSNIRRSRFSKYILGLIYTSQII